MNNKKFKQRLALILSMSLLAAQGSVLANDEVMNASSATENVASSEVSAADDSSLTDTAETEANEGTSENEDSSAANGSEEVTGDTQEDTEDYNVDTDMTSGEDETLAENDVALENESEADSAIDTETDIDDEENLEEAETNTSDEEVVADNKDQLTSEETDERDMVDSEGTIDGSGDLVEEDTKVQVEGNAQEIVDAPIENMIQEATPMAEAEIISNVVVGGEIPTYATDDTSDNLVLADGIYTIDANFMNANSPDRNSSADGCIEGNKATLEVKNGEYTVYLNYQSILMMGKNIHIVDSAIYDDAKSGSKQNVSVLSTYEDAGVMYAKQVAFKLESLDSTINMAVTLDYDYKSSDLTGTTEHDVLLKLTLPEGIKENISQGNIPTYETNESVDGLVLEDGTYNITANFKNANNPDRNSGANGCLNTNEAVLEVKNGEYIVYLTYKATDMMGKNVHIVDSAIYDDAKSGSKQNVGVISTYEDEGVTYAKQVAFKLAALDSTINMAVTLDYDYKSSDLTGTTEHDVLLQLDLPKVEEAPSTIPVYKTSEPSYLSYLDIKDGTYDISAYFKNVSSPDKDSAANKCLEDNKAVLEVKNGRYFIYLNYQSSEMMGRNVHVVESKIYDDEKSGASENVSVISNYDENGNQYAKQVVFELESLDETIHMAVLLDYKYTPGSSDLTGETWHDVLLKLDFSNSGLYVSTQVQSESTDASLTAYNTTLPSDARLVAINVDEAHEQYENVKNAVSAKLTQYKAYDMEIMKGNDVLDIEGSYIVRLAIPEGYSKDKVCVYFLDDDGTLTEMNGYVDGDEYVFMTTHFSLYIIGEKGQSTITPPSSSSNLYEDGIYNVSIKVYKTGSSSEVSMANDAIEESAQIKMSNGIGTIYLTTHPMTLMNITSSVLQLGYLDQDGSEQMASITSRTLDGTPTGFSFTLPHFEQYVDIITYLDIPIPGHERMEARLYIDYSTLSATSGINYGSTTLSEGIYDTKLSYVYNADENLTIVAKQGLDQAAKLESDGAQAKLYLGTTPFIYNNELHTIEKIEYSLSGSTYAEATVQSTSLAGYKDAFQLDLGEFSKNVDLKLYTSVEGMEPIKVSASIDYSNLEITADSEISLEKDIFLPNGVFTVETSLVKQASSTTLAQYSELLQNEVTIQVKNDEVYIQLTALDGSSHYVSALGYKKQANLGIYTEAASTLVEGGVSFKLGLDTLYRTVPVELTVKDTQGNEETVTAYLALDYTTVKLKQALAEKPVIEVAAKPYITGFEDGSFRPNATLTKGEVAMILAGLVNENYAEAEYNHDFVDLDADHEAAKAIAYLSEIDVLNGYQGKINANASVTRAEFVTMLVRLFDKENVQVESVSFKDMTSKHWAAEYVAIAVAEGWVNGYSNGQFKPQAIITRAEAVVILNRALGRTMDESELETLDVPKFHDVQVDHWAYSDIMAATIERA